MKFDVYEIAQQWLFENEAYVYHIPLSDEDLILMGFCNGYETAQQSMHLTAFGRGLALSLLFNIVLLAVLLVSIGGK